MVDNVITGQPGQPKIKLNKRETKALAKLPADAVALYMTIREAAAQVGDGQRVLIGVNEPKKIGEK